MTKKVAWLLNNAVAHLPIPTAAVDTTLSFRRLHRHRGRKGGLVKSGTWNGKCPVYCNIEVVVSWEEAPLQNIIPPQKRQSKPLNTSTRSARKAKSLFIRCAHGVEF